MVAETRISPDDFIAPFFVREGIEEPLPIASLPGVFQHTRASLVAGVGRARDLGVPAVVLFDPAPNRRDVEVRGNGESGHCRACLEHVYGFLAHER